MDDITFQKVLDDFYALNNKPKKLMTDESTEKFRKRAEAAIKRVERERSRQNKIKEEEVIIKTPRTYKTGRIMDGRSDLIKLDKGKGKGKYAVEAEIKLRKGLEPKVKRALKKAVDLELDERIKGGRVRGIDLDYSSSSTDEESSSDEEDTEEYKKILKHLLSHVRDPKEKKDPRDIRDIKGIMKRLKAKSR